MIIYEMQRGGKKVADVIVTGSKCLVVWPTSVIVYDSEDAARAVHIDHMGGRGEVTVFKRVWVSHESIMRGMNDYYQDSCENVPFASIGGLDARGNPQVPKYIVDHQTEYLMGYTTSAREQLGPDWATCSFTWHPTVVIGGEKETP